MEETEQYPRVLALIYPFTNYRGNSNLAPATVQPADIKVHENNTVAIQFDAPRDPEDPEKPIKVCIVIIDNIIIKYISILKLFSFLHFISTIASKNLLIFN